MKEENIDKLVSRYPNLYMHMKYFECANGWYALIDELSSELEKLIIDFNKTPDHEPEFTCCFAVQVKEKFGGLRFYMSCETDKMSDLIRKSEEDSYKICELCGDPGKPNNNGWITTLCDKCRNSL